ncbi:outer membrane autotransporter barrel domain protein [Sutterella sp. CAG:521]|nr:outer membrane autotransporter barrel domain protein [Sutterella sp. CAG:521]
MRKISLISVAVLAALSVTSVSHAAGMVKLDDGDNGPYRESVTIQGTNPDGTAPEYLSNQAANGRVDSVIASNAGSSTISYIKNEGKGQNLSIGSLTLEKGSADKPTIATLEFWGKDDSVDQTITVENVQIAEYGVLRIQEGKQFFSDNQANPKSSNINIANLNMGNKSAVSLGLATSGYSADSITIDTINVYDGEFAGIVAGTKEGNNNTIKVNTINIENNKLDLAGETEIENTGSSFLTGDYSKVNLVAQGDVVTVNMNSGGSQLVLGDVGKNIENSTTLDVNFSQEAFNSEESNVTFGTGAKVAETTKLSLTAENAAKGSNTENVEALNKLLGKVDTTGVSTTGGQVFASTSLTATSDVFDTVTAQTNEAGEVDTSTMRTHENAEVFSFAQLHSVGVMQWREEMNHMQLRLGEIRDAAGYNNGAWARIYNGKDEYGSQDVENKYYGVQVGYDHRLEGTNWIIGGAFSYARGDSTFSTGEGDNHNFTFTGYGTWLADNGLFVDVTGKIGRLSNDITIDHYTSDYDTNAVSVTAEAGWRFALNDIFYVEPQAEMMYGHIMSADYRTQTYKADTEAVDMWVGRLGFQTGLTCPEKKGGVYFRASVLHDFDGDAETKFTGLKSGDTRKVLDELGGTWYEMGIGANYNVTDNTYLYADFQYANGGEIDTPWRWNLGVRVNF